MNQQVRLSLHRLFGAAGMIRQKVYTRLASFCVEYAHSDEPVPFEKRKELKYLPIAPGQCWSDTPYGCGWFHLTATVPQKAKGKHVAFLIALGGEGCLIDNDGNPVDGLTKIGGFIEALQPAVAKRLIEYKQNADGGETLDLWIEAGNNHMLSDIFKRAYFKQADIVEVRDDIKAYYYDYLALLMQAGVCEEGKRYTITAALKASRKAAKHYAPEDVANARAVLAEEMKNGEQNPYTVYATGHAHLDLAWLWPIRETKRKAVRTFTNALSNIEKYDGYIFGASQPQQFAWMEKEYPTLFARLKEQIEAGRIEVQGGMWVECDTNVTSGESLIRQNLYGKRYWKEKFGKDMNFCWLPDVFGFSGNLPQILKKCGMDYFLTIKLSWCEHNKFPHRTFVWEGIDDSSVLVSMPPEETYNSDGTPYGIAKAVKNFPEKDVLQEFQMLYGIGDGGGGPGEGHIESVMREGHMAGMPKVVMTPAQTYFDRLGGYADKLPRYKGELYLEKHQGTYTTQGKNKWYNRKIETLLHNVELVGAAASLKGYRYPAARVEEIWKEVLLYQFHDIIPGSSIKRVYDESVARYGILYDELEAIEREALSYLKGEGDNALNATSYDIDRVVERNGKYYRFRAPAYGTGALIPAEENPALKAENGVLENEYLRVTIGKDGNLDQIVVKETGKEYAGRFMNRLNVYRDKRLYYNAWDIDINYTKKAPTAFTLESVSYQTESGAAIAVCKYRYGKSTLTQKIELKSGSRLVEFTTTVDWQETHKMLRAEFRPAVFAPQVTCDIQMGNLKRSTGDRSKIEKAQFEISAHKWIDVSENGYGLSVLSDCKYGWRVKEGLISLNMLRSPMWPAKNADKGTHIIRYALYPHEGDCYDANTAREGYFFNNPPIAAEGSALQSFVASDNPHVVVETVKPSENGEGIIVRMYEDSGASTTAKLSVSFPYRSVVETDLIETELGAIDDLTLTFKPFEIRTFLFR